MLENVPETLEYCRYHYVPLVKKYITCEYFGNIDGMSGGCWWCKEMTPYQWYMCSDESLVRSYSKHDKITREEEIEKVERYKNIELSRIIKRIDKKDNCNTSIQF